LILFALLSLLPRLVEPDPAPGVLRSKAAARQLDCARQSAALADALDPGALRPPEPRGDQLPRDQVTCRERLLRPGLRADRDEAILQDLADQSTGFAARAQGAEMPDHTWLVEVFDPSPAVAAKLGFATKSALVGQGLRVSDRIPAFAIGDLEVLTRMAPADAWPAACTRLRATGSLRPDDALLALVSLDPRATVLHAGLCAGGGWRWLP
jgi:hypothetical protein